MYTRETIQKNQRAFANNTFTHCASTTINATSSTSTSSYTSSSAAMTTKSPDSAGSNRSSSSLSTGTIAGIVVGAITGLLLFVGIFLGCLRKRRSDLPSDIVTSANPYIEQSTYQIEPFLEPHPGGQSSQYSTIF
jgi:hypothetical protein